MTFKTWVYQSILLYKDYGDWVPESGATVKKLHVISMGGSSFYRNPLESEAGRLPLTGATHCLATFSTTLLEKRLAGSRSFLCCPLLVCTTPVVGIGRKSAKGYFCWLFLIGFSLMILRRPIFVLILMRRGFYGIKMVDSFLSVEIGVSACLNSK